MEHKEKKELTLNEYQRLAMTTCMPSCKNEAYMILNLAGEVGELTSKMAKATRKEKAGFINNRFVTEWGQQSMSEQEVLDIKAECGDCLWMIAGFCYTMGWSLQEIGDENLAKLDSRKQRGVIDGNGDSR